MANKFDLLRQATLKVKDAAIKDGADPAEMAEIEETLQEIDALEAQANKPPEPPTFVTNA